MIQNPPQGNLPSRFTSLHLHLHSMDPTPPTGEFRESNLHLIPTVSLLRARPPEQNRKQKPVRTKRDETRPHQTIQVPYHIKADYTEVTQQPQPHPSTQQQTTGIYSAIRVVPLDTQRYVCFNKCFVVVVAVVVLYFFPPARETSVTLEEESESVYGYGMVR